MNTEPFKQIPLDLKHRTAYEREDFLVAPSNQDAVAWIDKWPEWPAPALILNGLAASGKSHLASVWAKRTSSKLYTSDDILKSNVETLINSSEHLCIKGVDLLIGERESEEKLFHIYNILKETKRTVLMTARAPLVTLRFEIADLASRLRAAPSVTIQAPDETLLTAILVKLFSDRQITVSDDIIQYILPRMERSFAAARDLVEKADARSLEEKRNITIPLIRSILIENY